VENACVNFTVVVLEGSLALVLCTAESRKRGSWNIQCRGAPSPSQILTDKSNPEISNRVFFFNATEIPLQDLLGWGRDLSLCFCMVLSTEALGPGTLGSTGLQRIARQSDEAC